MGIKPDVIESVYYTYSCRIPDDKSKWFSIMHAGANQGISYKTYDENALSVHELITDNQLYINWTDKLNTVN